MPTLMIADDHPLFREALSLAIESGLPNCHLLETGTLAQLINQLDQSDDLDLVLLDLDLPDAQGLDGLTQLRERFPELPIAIISADRERETILEAISIGAVGYIPKSAPKESLLTALHQMLEGHVYLPSEIMRRPVSTSTETPSDAPSPSFAKRLDSLTDKQLEVLARLTLGAANKVIARELNIAETTVKTHVSAILYKLNVRSRIQAVLAADQVELAADMARRGLPWPTPT
ncbi:response regulator [Halomonas halocynthiae]|uniref:response regulator n=1 Tax=Halomonas halocynthiae TaxID=176290 RepID=UPI00040BCB97|nr:response regulator transcription factor [Halomonas halocynthiae]